MNRTVSVDLDINKLAAPNPSDPLAVIQQGENISLTIEATITANGDTFDLTGKTARFCAIKPDGTAVMDDAVVADAVGGIITYDVANSVAQAEGRITIAYFEISDGDWVATTERMVIMVTKGINADTIISSDDFKTISKMLEEMQATYDTYKSVEYDIQHAGEVVAGIETAKEQASTAAKGANDAAAKASAAATSASDAASKANASASNADTAAAAAQHVADDVDAYMTRAEAAATGAEASKNASKASEDAAAASAQTASEKAAEANTAANDAASSKDAAAVSANAAAASQAAAKTSETNAKASETAAKASETAAKASQESAKASEDSAAGSASSASSSAGSASSDAATASSAAQTATQKAAQTAIDASNAASAANAAGTSEEAAAASETAAAASAKAADEAAKKAEAIAGFTVDQTVTQDSTNPVASKAVAAYVAEMLASFTAISFEVVQSFDALPATGAAGTFYFVPAEDAGANDLYSEYVWLNGSYEKFGDIKLPDLAPYATMTWVNEQFTAQLASYYTSAKMDELLAKKQGTLTFDSVPTENSTNPVKSGGIFTALASKADTSTVTALSDTVGTLSGTVANKQDALTFDSAPVSGSANPVTSGGVFTALSTKANSTDLTELSETVGSLGTALGGKQDKLTIDNTFVKTSANLATSKAIAGYVDTEVGKKQDALTFDSTPTSGSNNPVTSSGIKSYVDSVLAGIEEASY